MSYKHKQIKDLAKGRQWEKLFCEITGATKGTFNEDVNQHTDVWLDGQSVDVKGLKRSHKKGNALLEFLNVQGRKGWCSPVGAERIAFLFPDGFYVVSNKTLWSIYTKMCYENSDGVVDRRNGLKSEDKLYRLVGRTGRKDVFTYIKKEDITDIKHDFYAV